MIFLVEFVGSGAYATAGSISLALRSSLHQATHSAQRNIAPKCKADWLDDRADENDGLEFDDDNPERKFGHQAPTRVYMLRYA